MELPSSILCREEVEFLARVCANLDALNKSMNSLCLLCSSSSKEDIVEQYYSGYFAHQWLAAHAGMAQFPDSIARRLQDSIFDLSKDSVMAEKLGLFVANAGASKAEVFFQQINPQKESVVPAISVIFPYYDWDVRIFRINARMAALCGEWGDNWAKLASGANDEELVSRIRLFSLSPKAAREIRDHRLHMSSPASSFSFAAMLDIALRIFRSLPLLGEHNNSSECAEPTSENFREEMKKIPKRTEEGKGILSKRIPWKRPQLIPLARNPAVPSAATSQKPLQH